MALRGDDVSALIRRRREALAVAALLLIALALRVYEFDWDQGHLYHPDERFILLSTAAISLSWPINLALLLTPKSTLIPQDFSYSYGTFSFYVLRIVAALLASLSHLSPLFAGFNNLNDLGNLRLVGRPISALFDTATVFLVYRIGRQLYGRRVGFLAAAFVTFSVIDIQLSHFYATDTIMTGLVVAAIAFSLSFLKTGKTSSSVWAGVFVGLALATKASAALVLAPFVAAHLLRWFTSDAEVGRVRVRTPDATRFGDGLWVLVVSLGAGVLAFLIAEPYAVIDFRRYIGGVLEQSNMVRGIADLPYTRQYFARLPYLYFLQNLVLFGVGIPLGVAMIAGWLYVFARNVWRVSRYDLVILAYVIPYFAITGDFWAKFMRYLLPISPFLALFTAVLLVRAFDLVRGWHLWSHPELAPILVPIAQVLRMPPELIDESLAEQADWDELAWFDDNSSRELVEPRAIADAKPVHAEVMVAPVAEVLDPEAQRWFELKGLAFDFDEVDELLPLAGPPVMPATNGHATTPAELTEWVDVTVVDEVDDPPPAPIVPPGWLQRVPLLTRLAASRWTTRVVGATVAAVLACTVFYALAYDHMYASETTPAAASAWLYDHAKRGAVIATEHWEEGMPVPLANRPGPSDAQAAGYQNLTMPMYEDDNAAKLTTIVNNLQQADYVVFFSNRLYGTVPRIPARYPMSQRYYERLFGEQLGFKLVWASYRYPNLLGVAFVDDTTTDPGLPTPELLQNFRPQPITINLGHADESFTVYDHQKVLIFQKVQTLSPAELSAMIGPPANPLALQTQTSPNGAPVQYKSLLLSSTQAALVKAGGTFRDIFNRNDLSNQFPLLVWILLVAVIGLAGVPLGFLTFRRLPDRGYLVAKTLAILALVWLSWLVVSLGLVQATRLEAVLAALAVVAIGVVAGYLQRRELVPFLRARWRLLVVEEAVFWVALLYDVYIRALNPDLWHPALGGEKPMDLAYLTAAIRSPVYPPYDPWFAGGYLNYYYFGQIVVGTLIKISGILPTTAYNLAVPLLFALTVGGAFTAALGLIHRGEGKPRSSTVVGGVLAALMVCFLGNLGGFLQIVGELSQDSPVHPQTGVSALDTGLQALIGFGAVLVGNHPLVIPQDWYWSSTRMLALLNIQGGTGSINEFPYFTFLFADLHAHLIGLPFTLLALVLCVNFVKGATPADPPAARAVATVPQRELAPIAGGAANVYPMTHARSISWPTFRVSISTMAAIGFAGLVVGALYPINSWDYPTYLGLLAVSLLIPWYLSRQPDLRGLGVVLAQVACVAILSQVLYRPFYAYFQSFYSGVHLGDEKSNVLWYVMINGLFLAVLLSYILIEGWVSYRRSGLLRSARLYLGRWDSLPRTLQLQKVLVHRENPRELLSLYGLIFLGLVVALCVLTGMALVGLLLVFLAATLVLGLRRARSGEECLMLLLFATGLAISIGTEIVVIDGDVGRMNTIFKFYEQVWVLFGVASAVALVQLAGRLPLIRSALLRRFWIAAIVALFVMALIYPVVGTKARVSQRFDQSIPPTLDGTAYMDRATYGDMDDQTHVSALLHLATDQAAMTWLQDHVDGTPTILEGNRPLYRWGSRMSIYTGLPTVIGWDWHQKQQRSGYQSQIDDRLNDVRTMYDVPNVDQTLALLHRYDVTYIIDGELEQGFYPTARAKFDSMVGTYLTVAYDQNGVRIYQVK
jgi:YYY domain-containing protein